MIAFKAIIFNRLRRIELDILAHNSVEATRIGIGMMPLLDGHGPVGITCTPLRGQRKETPCAA